MADYRDGYSNPHGVHEIGSQAWTGAQNRITQDRDQEHHRQARLRSEGQYGGYSGGSSWNSSAIVALCILAFIAFIVIVSVVGSAVDHDTTPPQRPLPDPYSAGYSPQIPALQPGYYNHPQHRHLTALERSRGIQLDLPPN